jgi:pyrimidine-nucleoside phosphorylase
MMIELGEHAGREVVCLISDMDQPLGCAVGNALEIREAVATLHGEGPADFTELVLVASAKLLALSDLGVDEAEGRRRAEAALADGSALAAYETWIRAQGGDPSLAALPVAPIVLDVLSPVAGYVTRLGATAVGMAALRLGAGRSRKEDSVDHAVGIVLERKRSDRVEVGDVLARVHARTAASAERAAGEVLAAYTLGPAAPAAQPIVLDVLQ